MFPVAFDLFEEIACCYSLNTVAFVYFLWPFAGDKSRAHAE